MLLTEIMEEIFRAAKVHIYALIFLFSAHKNAFRAMNPGTPLTESAIKVMLLGSGELGKEVAIELQRIGTEVIAVDSYPNAPAMQVSHRSYVISMLDGAALRELVYKERPHLIVPEVEAIATETLVELEKEGFTVIPTARAAQLTMNREGIRELAAGKLGLKTSPYRFAGNMEEFKAAVLEIGLPCVVKPVMSSSGKGQSVLRSEAELEKVWNYAMEGGRGKSSRVIVEGFIQFDSEITLLTLSHCDGISFCAPIGHRQEHGDYQESWQPHEMSATALEKAQQMATSIVKELGGYGIFGVEFFIAGDEVIFSELSPRPHDTGMVTLISQDLSEFALHARAILGLPVPQIQLYAPSASKALLVKGVSKNVSFCGVNDALRIPGTAVRFFGKPEVKGERRMGVALATAPTIESAIDKVKQAAGHIKAEL
jgi:phosphoribosylglycinamide formyltransferase 2